MYPIIKKTFGGLSTQYYFRQLFFGVALAAFMYFLSTQGGRAMPMNMMLFTVLSTLLYPYARFVYEGILGFVLGENVFFVNAIFSLIVKLITMTICWVFALFVAPVGLAYLYYRHSKSAG
ncbi:MAG: hypothetical protein ACK40L_09205 [Hydrogenophaga sp.]